jgi:peptide/nickel transport system ATP-binding protein
MSDTAPPVLDVNDLAVAYKVRSGEVVAVHDVSFTIRRGETYGLVGESGCGKSTIAWAIVNFLGQNGYVKRGSIIFQGQELVGQQGETLRQLRGSQIAMVYQDPMRALNPSMRVGDQLKEVLVFHQAMTDQEAAQRCLAMLERVYMPDPEDVMRRYPHQISGGQQQRVVIAMALLNNPALLIMDEPTTALDVTVEAAVLDLIAELRQASDTAIIYITHNLGVVARVCDRVGVMYAGELVERAPVEALFQHPRHPYTQGLMRCVPTLGDEKAARALAPIRGRVPPPDQRPDGCIFNPRCDYAVSRCREERPHLRLLEEGSCVRCHLAEYIAAQHEEPYPSGQPMTGDVQPPTQDAKSADHTPILHLEQFRKYYQVPGNRLRDVLGLRKPRYVRAVEDIDLEVLQGCTLGVVGESGCGKSTLVKTIIGLEPSTEGQAKFIAPDTQRVFDLSKALATRPLDVIRELQMVFQNPDATLNPAYTVCQQISRPMLRFGIVTKSEVRAEVIRLLEAMRLDQTYCDRYPSQLSGGEKQRVSIARALASRPDLILCDEPVSSLDVSVQAAILNLLLAIQEQYDTTMIFIAHDLSVVRYLSDFIAVMYLGQIVEFGPSKAIYAPPYHPYTEALLSAVPIPDPTVEQKHIRLDGVVPSAINPPSGCRFHTRCPRRHLLPDTGAVCERELPPWHETDAGHRILCHLPLEVLSGFAPVVARHQG